MVAKPLRWTTRDLAAMRDDGRWKRYEIVDGELFVTQAPHIRHQSVAGKLQVRLELWSEKAGLGNAFQTPGIVLSPTDAVIPDVIWISQERLSSSVDDVGHLTVAPELVVDVISPGELNEQGDKEVGRASEKRGIGNHILPRPRARGYSSSLSCRILRSTMTPNPIEITDDQSSRDFGLLP